MIAGATRRTVALALGASLAWPVLAAAEPTGSVAVDASGLEAVGEALAPEVTRQLDTLLKSEGLDPASLRVRIVWLDADAFHYAIRATFDRELPDDQIPIVETCEACSKEDVVGKTVEVVRRELIPAEKERLAKAEPPPPDGDEGADTDPDTDTGEPPIVPPPDNPDRPGPLGNMGWSGVGLLVAGAAAAITGGALVGVGTTRPAADMSQIRDFRPTGYALLGTGGAMLVVGAILLGVDRARAKKGKRRSAGLLQGRF